MQLTFEGKTIDQLAIELIQAYEPPEGYYLGFSGGKDSVVIYDLTKRAGVKFQPTYNVSPIDPPEIHSFIKEQYPDVLWEKHATGFWTKHFLSHGAPLRHRRWCCELIKENGGGNQATKILGMRSAESERRKNYCVVTYPRNGAGIWILPILTWSTADVWQYITEYSLPFCSLYSVGFSRIGCVMCPFTSKPEMKAEMERYPKIANNWKSACIRYYQKRIERGTPLNFKSGEEYFNWWIKR